MTPEHWGILAAVLLLVAIAARMLALFSTGTRWKLVVIGARLGAGLGALVALILMVGIQGGWSPFAPRQLALGLALASICAHLLLTWRGNCDGAGPVADLVVLGLVVWGLFAPAAGRQLSCAQDTIPFGIQWGLFLAGGGAVLVAASTALVLALQRIVAAWGPDLHWPMRHDLYRFLVEAAALALTVLGGGLVLSAWWAWRSEGALSDSDPREIWIAITWLLVAMSWLTRHWNRRWRTRAAALAIVAAATLLIGLFFVVDLRRLWGI
jgi:hypothetical protein